MYLSKIRVLLITFLTFGITSVLFAQIGYREIDVKNGGTIKGTVTLKGTPPSPEIISVSADTASCGKTKTLSSLIIGPNQGVKDTIIGLEGVTQGRKLDQTVAVELDQLKCEYAPHILIVPKGATLQFMNHDAILHNIHAYDLQAKADAQTGPKTLFNMALPLKGMKIAKPMSQSGLLRMLCDAGHPWMNAYVLVTEHPYFAVTDENGNFVLSGVPPGTYTITMWHEGRAKVETSTKSYAASAPYRTSQKVTVTAGGTAQVNFTLDVASGGSKGTSFR
jgi:plastocyanin